MISKDRYCIEICKAKCCTHKATGHKCCHLAEDNKCKIYKERFGANSKESEIVDVWQHNNKLYQLICGRIEKIIASNSLDPEIRAQCCYANPSVLDGDFDHGSETNS